MKKTILVLAALTFFGCNKSKNIRPDTLDIGMEFSVFSSQNEDLLDPATTNYFEASGIKLFYEINGEIKEIYDPNLDNPRNFRIYKHENEYRIGIALNYTETSVKPITYIQWNNNDTDTIEVVYDRNEGSPLKRKVWLNDLEIWDRTTNGNEYYKLIK